ncbi:hypothetical protein EBT31_22770, partial [bacterium]|nr:hypothetical protein [bacterium]
NTEIKSIKDINSSRPESKKELATLQERLNALKALKEGISEAKKASDKGNIDSIEEMYDQVNRALLDYASTFTPKFRRNPELLNDVVESVFDYHMLTKDNEHLQDHINFLNNPEYANRFMDAAEKTNKSKIARLEAQIKDSLDAFEERKKASTMMQILTEKGLIFDMNEIDDLVERGIMPSRIYNAVTHKKATPEEEAEVHRIIEAIYKNVKNKKIANDKSSITRAGAYRAEKDNRTVKEIVREYRLKMDEDIDLSTPSGKSLIKRVLKSGNLRATDVEILEELLDKGGVIRFVTNAEMPITFKDGVTTIDLRFAGSEFRNTRLSFEGLFTVALLQDKVAKKVISDSEFAG